MSPHSFQTVVWVVLSPTRTRYVKVLWDRTYGFLSLSKKTRNSIHLQMSLHKRQHFLLSYLKTLSVGSAKVWICDLPSADQCSPKWANQVVIKYELSVDISTKTCWPTYRSMSVECWSHIGWVLVECQSHTDWGIKGMLPCQLFNFTSELIVELHKCMKCARV